MKLILLRHGKALNGERDDTRDLTDEGREEVSSVAEKLAEKGFRPDRIVHSPKIRAKATAAILSSVAGGTLVEDSNVKPGSDPDIIAAEADDWSGTVAIVSHLPYLPELLRVLSGEQHSFRPAQAIVLENSDSGWRLLDDIRPV